MDKRKICLITATRAEYSYLKQLIFLLEKEESIITQVLVTGTHLDKNYGYTITEIEKDGIIPDILVEIIENDSAQGILKTMANATSKVGEALQKLEPDLVVLLGDRYEIFAIASACVVLNIPIAHISGGDITYGAFDDIFRHSLTKMSNLHFTSCEEYRKRVIQLGEQPDTVFNVGSLSLSNIKTMTFLREEEINKDLAIQCSNTLLATFHPVTMEKQSQSKQFLALLDALIEQDKYVTLFTRANADTGSSELNNILDKYIEKYPHKIKAVDSLGALLYMSMMKYCRAVIGNSSSGILEAPSFKVPTLNIGNRQQGRLQAKSIINCDATKSAISKALQELPSRESLKFITNPYEKNNTAQEIVDILKKTNLQELYKKNFYNIKFNI